MNGMFNLTEGVKNSNIPIEKIKEIVRRWENEDYGSLNKEDVELNHRNLKNGIIDVMGCYKIDGTEIWVWAQGSFVPTVLLPSEY